MLDPDVEESQLNGQMDEMDNVPQAPSSPIGSDVDDQSLPDTQVGPSAEQHSGSDDEFINAPDSDEAQDSLESRVDETQYVAMELDTQAQESHESVVLETQFVEMEPDTQAVETQSPSKLLLSPNTRRLLQAADAKEPSPPHTSTEPINEPLFFKPNVEESGSSFSFSKAAKPIPGQFSGRPRQPSPPRVPASADVPTAPVSRDQPTPLGTVTNPQPLQPELPSKSKDTPKAQPLIQPMPRKSLPVQAPEKESTSQEPLGHDRPPKPVTRQSSAPDTSTVPRELPPVQLQNSQPPQVPSAQETASKKGNQHIQPPKIIPVPQVQQPNIVLPPLPLPRQEPASKPTPRRVRKPPIPTGPKLQTAPGTTSNNGRKISQPFPEMKRPAAPQTQHRASNSDGRSAEAPKRPLTKIQNAPFPEALPTVDPRVRSAAPLCGEKDHIPDEQLGTPETTSRQHVKAANAEEVSTKDVDLQTDGHVTANHVRTDMSGYSTATAPPQQQMMQQTDQNASATVKGGIPHTTDRNVAIIRRQPSQEILGSTSISKVDTGSRDTADSNMDSQPPMRNMSPTPTDHRPSSARSNIGTPMARPMAQNGLEPRVAAEHTVLQPKHPAKVQKPREKKIPGVSKASVVEGTGEQMDSTRPVQASPTKVVSKKQMPTVSSFRKLVDNVSMFENMLEDYKVKLELVEIQQQEIKKLTGLSEERQKKVEDLEVQKKDITQKLNRYGTFHAQYKDHMNKVVNSQRLLIHEAKEMRETSDRAIKEYKTKEQQQSVVDQMSLKIKEIKEMSFKANELAAKEKEMMKRIAVAEGQAETFKADALKMREFEAKYNNALTSSEILKKDLENNLLTLSREKHNSEQIHKQLTSQLETQKELTTLLKKIPGEVVNNFTKDEGALAKLLASESATQAKLDQAMNLVNELKSHESQPPPGLVKLLEDLCNRIENKVQTSDVDAKSVQESVNKLLEDFKERLGQLNTDTEAHNNLIDRVAELREANATLTAEKSARELEIQNVSKQLEEVQRDLGSCRGELLSKTEQLAALEALPKEDPQLLAKIQELENTNSSLVTQINTNDSELSKAREDLKTTQETSSSHAEYSRVLQEKLNEAENRISGFEDEMKKLVACREADIEMAKADVAKMASTTTSDMQIKFDSKVNTLTLRKQELEEELKTAKEDLRKSQEERAASSTDSEQVLSELAAYKEQFTLQATALLRLEQHKTDWDLRDRRIQAEFEPVSRELTELRGHLETTRSAAGHDIDTIFDGQQELERNFQILDRLQQENARHKEQNDKLQKQQENSDAILRKKDELEKANLALEEETATLRNQLEEAVDRKVEALELEKTGLKKQVAEMQAQVELLQRSSYSRIEGPRQALQQALSRRSPHKRNDVFDLQPSPSTADLERAMLEDDEMLRGQLGSPKDMLRQAVKRNSLASNPHSVPGSQSNSSQVIPETQLDSQQAAPIPSSHRAGSSRNSRVASSRQPALHTTQSAADSVGSARAPATTQPPRRAAPRRASNRGATTYAEDTETPKTRGEQQMRPPPSVNSSIHRTSSASIDTPNAIKLFSSFTPVGQSPLTDLDPVVEQLELLHTQEQLDAELKKRRESKPRDPKERFTTEGVKSQHQWTGPPFKRNSVPVNQQFPDAGLPPTPVTKSKSITIAEESSRRRASKPLKSALKPSQSTPATDSPELQGALDSNSTSTYFKNPTPNSALQDKHPGLGVNKKQARTPAATYNRIAAGMSSRAKVGSSNNPRGTTDLKRALSRKPSNTNGSPLPNMPSRARKRSVEVPEGDGRIKVPRISLPHQASNRVIPDSQERR